MFAPFSNGYYVGRMVVEPHDGDEALIPQSQHERMNEQLYAEGTGIERLDNPLIMKLDRRHFPVHGDRGVPHNTLLVPEWVRADVRDGPLPAVLEVLLAKAEAVPRLLHYCGLGDDVVAT